MSKSKQNKLKFEYIDLNNIRPYEYNARIHSEKQIDRISKSIKEFGFLSPCLIDKNNNLIAGHGRVDAARKAGITQAPCIRVEHLSEKQKKAYIIADNRLAELSSWNDEILREELSDICDKIDLAIIGFDDFVLDPNDFDPATEEDQGKLDRTASQQVKCPNCGHVIELAKGKSLEKDQ